MLVDLLERAEALLGGRASVQRPARIGLGGRPAARERGQRGDEERALQLAATIGVPFTPGALSTIMPFWRHFASVRSVISPRLRRFGTTVCM